MRPKELTAVLRVACTRSVLNIFACGECTVFHFISVCFSIISYAACRVRFMRLQSKKRRRWWSAEEHEVGALRHNPRCFPIGRE